MRYVVARSGRDGTCSDPQPYLARLPELAPLLPPGARAFATDLAHYDYTGSRCVKDLQPVGLDRRAGGAELRLRHNCWKHEEDLVVRYTGVREVVVEGVAGFDKLGGVVLDEVIPDGHGCRHEIACVTGTLVLTGADLAAVWEWADCPQRGRG